MLDAIKIPGLFITGTDTDVGKTVIAGGIAGHFARRGWHVAVSKPLASGCASRREGLVSEDAEMLASCADAQFPLDVICPVRYREALAPALAAERLGEPLDWNLVRQSLNYMTDQTTENPAKVIIVEGAGGVMTPLDDKHTMLDLARWLALPAVVVARPDLGTINHTVLTVEALRRAGVRVAGVVINRYPAQSATIAQENNPRYIEKWAKTPVLTIVPEHAAVGRAPLPGDVQAAIDLVDWEKHL